MKKENHVHSLIVLRTILTSAPGALVKELKEVRFILKTTPFILSRV
jgi:hypothetical protein